ncbi:hypothetical protein ARAM_005771 [Aspergillus rambellii]|uniref:Altered inheritance of mitochondria protein 9, mitochondrial n=1 Tax=Aspergillus rambellii TaxID=308745 RepID=A0A0F8U787_9EURO|nr:hypothetical protein ARAM_005771 [Aspergillus rambellii]
MKLVLRASWTVGSIGTFTLTKHVLCQLLSTRLRCDIQNLKQISKQYRRSMSKDSSSPPGLPGVDMRPSETDWNSSDEFFKFTRGRFIVEEAKNLQMRETRFDLNQLARVAADSVGAGQCISIKKYPDGMFNKTFLMTMDNGQEVVSKVPNPNAGVPHFTTASEVATMDFARKVLDTPVPQVYLWNSQAESHPVGAEFIIMDKVKGVPLSQVWGTMKLPQKLKADIERIKLDSDAAVAGTDLVLEVKESLGDLWPDKGFIEHAQYDDCKAALDNVKCQILEQLAETEEEKAKYERYWPFD